MTEICIQCGAVCFSGIPHSCASLHQAEGALSSAGQVMWCDWSGCEGCTDRCARDDGMAAEASEQEGAVQAVQPAEPPLALQPVEPPQPETTFAQAVAQGFAEVLGVSRPLAPLAPLPDDLVAQMRHAIYVHSQGDFDATEDEARAILTSARSPLAAPPPAAQVHPAELPLPPEWDHIESADCWCRPEVAHRDPETGETVWVHRRGPGTIVPADPYERGYEHGYAQGTEDAIEQRPQPAESVWLTLREELNAHTVNLVVRFARALAAKLAAAEKKYGYSDEWRSPGWMDECRQKLREHVEKGDPRDVAAYCAFLWFHNESTAAAPPAAVPAQPAAELSIEEWHRQMLYDAGFTFGTGGAQAAKPAEQVIDPELIRGYGVETDGDPTEGSATVPQGPAGAMKR